MMSDKLREAAKRVADLIEHDNRYCAFAAGILRVALAEPAIKESLTVAEQKPVAWKHPNKNVVFWENTKEVDEYHGFKPTIPLYTAPPRREWVGLTGPEVDEAYGSVSDKEWAIGGLTDARVFFCAIEAKLKDKNT